MTLELLIPLRELAVIRLIEQDDGSLLQWFNCTMATGAMCVALDSGGDIYLEPGDLRRYTRDQIEGTGLADLNEAIARHPRLGRSYVLPVYSTINGTLDTSGQQALEWLAEGYALGIQVRYEAVPLSLACQRTRKFGHAMLAYGLRIRAGRVEVRVFDPLCAAPKWYPLEVFLEACFAYAGRGDVSCVRTRTSGARAPAPAEDVMKGLLLSDNPVIGRKVVDVVGVAASIYDNTEFTGTPVVLPRSVRRLEDLGVARDGSSARAVRISTDDWTSDKKSRWYVGYVKAAQVSPPRDKTELELAEDFERFFGLAPSDPAVIAERDALKTRVGALETWVKVTGTSAGQVRSKANEIARSARTLVPN